MSSGWQLALYHARLRIRLFGTSWNKLLQRSPKFTLNIPFKGNRRYVRGADLFNALAETIQFDRDIDLRFHKPMLGPVCVEPVPPLSKIPSDSLTTLSVGQPGSTSIWVVRDMRDPPAIERVPFDEDANARGAEHSPGVLEQAENPGASFIDRVVALNKKLLILEGLGADWWFGRLSLARVPSTDTALRLRIVRRLGVRLIESAIDAANDKVGQIFFSVKT
jgi:hypothetical protein